MASDSPKDTPHRATSQLTTEPPHGLPGRVVVDPEVLIAKLEEQGHRPRNQRKALSAVW